MCLVDRFMSQWSSVAEVDSLLRTAENLKTLWRAGICKISQQKRRIYNFLQQNFVFVKFCNKNVTFSDTRYTKIPNYSENILGRVRVLLEIIGSGRVSGTRLTLHIAQEGELRKKIYHWWKVLNLNIIYNKVILSQRKPREKTLKAFKGFFLKIAKNI